MVRQVKKNVWGDENKFPLSPDNILFIAFNYKKNILFVSRNDISLSVIRFFFFSILEEG